MQLALKLFNLHASNPCMGIWCLASERQCHPAGPVLPSPRKILQRCQDHIEGAESLPQLATPPESKCLIN